MIIFIFIVTLSQVYIFNSLSGSNNFFYSFIKAYPNLNHGEKHYLRIRIYPSLRIKKGSGFILNLY